MPGHVVLFYEHDEQLARSVGTYLLDGLRAGDVAVVVATEPHLRAFEAVIADGGVDVDGARADGRLVTLDAGELLDRFVVEGWPEAVSFDAVVGDLVRRAGGGGRGVRVYGEMVALLWDAGHVPAAIELEALWNRLGGQVPFSLFCAYPAASVAGDGQAAAVARVCALHAEVVDGGHRPAVAEETRTFDVDPTALGTARRFVAGVLQAWGYGALAGERGIEDLRLAVGELVSNAVRHGRAPIGITLSRHPDRVRIEVRDHGGGRPAVREVEPTGANPGGWGLRFVDHLADTWGTHTTGGITVVWLERLLPWPAPAHG
jgi:anti-sigma regulatory factor (Ser/Thr protein kinase)